MSSSVSILNTRINLQSYQSALKEVSEKAAEGKQSFYCFANVHMVVEAKNNRELHESLEKAQKVFPDGVPISKSINKIYSVNQERIAGMDFLPDILKVCHSKKYTIFFLGSTDKIIAKAIQKIHKNYPDIVVVGSICPPFKRPWKNEKYIKRINESNPHMVFISFGCPKQEIWMSKYSERIRAPLLGIGAALPVFVGLQKRAPRMMQNMGLEWLFRLGQEPRRLFKRYFRTNSTYIYHITKQYLKNS